MEYKWSMLLENSLVLHCNNRCVYISTNCLRRHNETPNIVADIKSIHAIIDQYINNLPEKAFSYVAIVMHIVCFELVLRRVFIILLLKFFFSYVLHFIVI